MKIKLCVVAGSVFYIYNLGFCIYDAWNNSYPSLVESYMEYDHLIEDVPESFLEYMFGCFPDTPRVFLDQDRVAAAIGSYLRNYVVARKDPPRWLHELCEALGMYVQYHSQHAYMQLHGHMPPLKE